MSSENLRQRREVIAGLAGLGAVLAGASAIADAKGSAVGHAGHDMKDAAPPPPLSAAHKALIQSTADCLRAGRLCMARCTDHLAAGTALMADCQRAVMNMLPVVEAMADVAGYANTSQDNLKTLAKTCAQFCRSCAEACEPHAAHHEECKACQDACIDCADACDALVG
jgi:Cys-rich four helix bundle protein (predicted Tat secretion target)